jgi:hypothetical protein
VASFEIKTAEEFAARDPQSRWLARRTARETAEFRSVLRLFVDQGGPVPLEAIALGGLRDTRVRQLLTALDDEDLIRIQGDHVDVAYPFTASPTPFIVRLRNGLERFACCAVDALGIAPMIGDAIEIRSHCHHCREPLELTSTPEGARPEGSTVMLWIGRRADDRCKIADSL